MNSLLPGSTIGILGGGQLGRMMAMAAKHMGYKIVVLDPTPDCPAAQVSDEQIVAKYDDLDAIAQLANKSDVVTYEFENVDLTAARLLETKGCLPQGSQLLKITQDREQEKTVLAENGLPVAPFKVVETGQELKQAFDTVGLPAVIKTCRGGYDGKGQLQLTSLQDLDIATQFIQKNGRCIVEQWIKFDKEVSVVFTRTIDGNISYFPLAENEHKNHILHKTTAPARVSNSVTEQALDVAARVAEAIEVVGTFAIEMFVVGEDIYINEMAPRPHNSGHFTIEACSVSQFEQHMRAICGLPLAPIKFHGASVMINLLGDDVTAFTETPEIYEQAHVHVYGKKEIKDKRKMGHVTYVGNSLPELEQIVADNLRITEKV
ncbi:5-(carboxyamino)imidazole ribonucleotide synthase [Radiobacillus sp. PE A8.2]|uniref:5-(carboxyamino)imidazole ribonucleotide synthase n=1 Tax=Radiobacillus sp. PE A8.2 TaxID=3380349 RepID=UPI003890DEA8